MTEPEWLASDDPQAMLLSLEREWDKGGTYYVVSDRKLRLFAVACWWAGPPDTPNSANSVWTEGLCQLEELAEGQRKAFTRQVEGYICATPNVPTLLLHLSGLWSGLNIAPKRRIRHMRLAANLLRDIVGNPYRTLGLTDADYVTEVLETWPEGGGITRSSVRWHTPQVKSLAVAAYAEPLPDGTLDPFRLALIADALEEAGCTKAELLRHLRGWERCPLCQGEGGYVQDTGGTLPWGDSIGEWVTCECVGPLEHTGWIKLRGPHVRGCWAIDLVLGKE